MTMMTVAKTIAGRISLLASKMTSRDWTPRVLCQRPVLLQSPEHVLDVDDGVIDQHADCDRQSLPGSSR